jgi:type IX secretion system PorP/SprF family membrane protein
MSRKKSYLILLLNLSFLLVKGQDPHFSQYFMAPHFINPAKPGTQYGDWSIMGNFRQQWSRAGTAFLTNAIAAEGKLTGQDQESNVLALGVSFMNDQSMRGSFKSNYLSTSLAYHLQLNDNHKIGIGFQASYNKRNLDYRQLSFGEQFNGRNFDLTIPNGETNLENMPAFYALGTGINYKYSTYNFNIDLGLAVFNLNRPNQSFLNQVNKVEPRYTFNTNLDYYSEGSFIFNLNGFYHLQTKQSYFSVGSSVGIAMSPTNWDKILYTGIWFREGDAVVPYAGFQLNDLRIGLTYDVTYSKQNKGPNNPQSIELSFIYTKSRKNRNAPPCPIPDRHMGGNIKLN